MEKKIKQVNVHRTNLAVADPDEAVLNSEVIISSVITDPDGNETERITYDAFGNPEERVVIHYRNGLPVEEAIEMGGEPAERTTREYDENGRVVKEFRHYLEGDPDEIRYVYDQQGNLLSRQVFDSDGEEGERQLWLHSDGLLVREESYNEYGDLEQAKTLSYSGDRKPEETTETNFSGGEETRLVTVYDAEGRVEAEKRYDSRGRLVARNLYQYDEKGNNTIIEEESVRGKSVVTLQYDEAGNNILQEETGPDGTVVTRIVRTWDTDNRPSSTEVRMEGTAQRMGQHYRIRFEYIFHE